MDLIQEWIVVITAVVGALTAVWKLIRKQEDSYEDYAHKYYSEILEPTINQVVLNKDTLKNELMNHAKQKYSYIPTYINYMIHLINRGSTKYSWDDVKKVITVDYIYNRPGLRNNRMNSLNKMGNTVIYILNIVPTVLGIIIFPSGIALEVAILVSSISEVMRRGQLVVTNESICIALIALSMIIFGLILIRKVDVGGYELYSNSTKEIEKIISDKCKKYTIFMDEYKAINPNTSEENYDMLYLCINRVIRNECSNT